MNYVIIWVILFLNKNFSVILCFCFSSINLCFNKKYWSDKIVDQYNSVGKVLKTLSMIKNKLEKFIIRIFLTQ